MRRNHLVPLFALCSSVVLATSCADDPLAGTGLSTADAGDGATLPDAPPSADVTRAPRHPVGHTLVLPAGAFGLVSAPARNQNGVFVEGGRTLFVPHVEGEYVFTDGARRFEATVVPASTLAFHNVNHYPTRSIEQAGPGALWVVGTLVPELVRIDEASRKVVDRIPVGSWPVAVRAVRSRNAVLVANRGEDTLSWVDLETRRVTRSIFVGDEVSNVDVTADGRLALALLPNDGEVAIVDLESKSIRARVAVGVDPTYVTTTKDSRRAYVAGRRTGEGSGRDLLEIDLESGTVARTVEDVGTTLGGLTLSDDEKVLYVAALRNDPRASLANPEGGTFRHHVVAYDLAGTKIEEKLARDVTLSVAAAGTAQDLVNARLVSLHAPLVVGDDLWVLSEANDMAIRLARDTFEERERVAVAGRPRSLFRTPEGKVYAFGHQALTLTDLAAKLSVVVADDPRPVEVARGQRFFTGTGKYLPAGPPGSGLAIAGDRWSCNSCHADGSSDKLVWQAGPVPTHRYASRPYVMLEATWPLGWQGYLSTVRNYAVTVTGNIGVNDPTTEEATTLAAYLSSIMPPARATTLTERDGSLTPLAKEGAAVFAKECAGCHSGALTTSRRRVDRSIGDGKVADIPSLVGIQRQGVYFRDGSAKTLDAAVEVMAKFADATLDPKSMTALKRYVAELTSRDFFATSTFPSPATPLASGSPFAVTFSYPVLPTPENLEKVKLFSIEKLSGNRKLAAKVTVEGRRITVVAAEPLPASGRVLLAIDGGFEAEDGRQTTEALAAEYGIAATPTLALVGTYSLTYTPVSFGPPGSAAVPLSATLVATKRADGSSAIEVSFPNKLVRFPVDAVVSGNRLVVPPIPLAVSGSFADGFSGFEADLVDTNGDGIADGVGTGTGQGGARVYTMAGPGFEAPNLAWDLVRNP